MPNLPRALCLGLIAAAAVTSTLAADQIVIGLITKTETNPFFVKMKEGATEAATAKGAKLLSGAGKTDGDNAGQVTAMENMIAAGAKTILITPSDSKAIVPSPPFSSGVCLPRTGPCGGSMPRAPPPRMRSCPSGSIWNGSAWNRLANPSGMIRSTRT